MAGDKLVDDAIPAGVVSIHARAWRATRRRCSRTSPRRCFNSRPRMAGDSNQAETVVSQFKFQFTPAHGGRQLSQTRRLGTYQFQFTPAHGGRLAGARNPHRPVRVSIHARAWRATASSPLEIWSYGFNSRPRMAGDSGVSFEMYDISVSIHARAWRATRPLSRPYWVTAFQFTPAHGGRRLPLLFAIAIMSFNSRPRMAGDNLSTTPFRRASFQFTPAHGGRRASSGACAVARTFQFTPAHGGRPAWCAASLSRRGFNSRPRMAGDWCRSRPRPCR